jgi:hypothetical protein
MTLRFSLHQYVEFVFDQSVPTWLGLTGGRSSGSVTLRTHAAPPDRGHRRA